jgi:hypothetical protein
MRAGERQNAQNVNDPNDPNVPNDLHENTQPQ